MKSIFTIIILCLIVSSCGDNASSPQVPGPNDSDFGLNDADSIIGQWHGSLNDMRGNSQATQHRVEMDFNKNEKFTLKTTDGSEGEVRGTYTKSLETIYCIIHFSNISIFGLKDDAINISYHRIGNHLTIFNRTMELSLERKVRINTSDGSTYPTNDPLYGNWQGRDNSGNLWNAQISYSGVFSARVSNEINRTMTLEGELTLEQNSNNKLGNIVITKSNNPEAINTKLEFELSLDGAVLEMASFDQDGQKMKEFSLVKVR
ncbi:MAG: hypothetical protein R3B45_17380 [Bdellovibrionota bacterium]